MKFHLSILSSLICSLAMSTASAALSWDNPASEKSASQFVHQLISQSKSIVNNSKSEPQQVLQFCQSISHYADLDDISKFVLAENWMRASAADKDLFKKAFTKVLATMFRENFGSKLNYQFKTEKVRAWATKPGHDVHVQFKDPQKSQTGSMVYAIKITPEGHAISNLIVTGIDLRKYFREKYTENYLRKAQRELGNQKPGLARLNQKLVKEFAGACP